MYRMHVHSPPLLWNISKLFELMCVCVCDTVSLAPLYMCALGDK